MRSRPLALAVRVALAVCQAAGAQAVQATDTSAAAPGAAPVGPPWTDNGDALARMAGPDPGAQPQPDPEAERRALALVAQLTARRSLHSGRLSFEGDVVAHLPWGVSRFTVHVEKDGPRAVITSADAPWYVPRRWVLALAPATDLLSNFDLSFDGIESDGAGVYLVLSGKHRVPSLAEARHGRLWLDPALGEIARIELSYVWGRVRSELSYGRVSARTVVVQQTVAVEPLGIRLTVRYRNFRWPPPDA